LKKIKPDDGYLGMFQGRGRGEKSENVKDEEEAEERAEEKKGKGGNKE
jgi:hypothetical protein